MKTTGNKKISEEEIQRALEEFRKQGRLIRKLLPQVTPRSNMVGERHGVYESMAGLAGE